MANDSVSIELPSAGLRPWEQLLRDVRDLEMRFDARIADYMKFVQPTSPRNPNARPSQSADDRQNSVQLEGEINTILGDLDAVVQEMEETVQHQRGSARVLERHRSLYSDYTREFQRYQSNVQASFSKADLIGGASGQLSTADTSDRDRLVAERSRIDQTHTDIDMVLDQAFSVRQDLAEQRTIMGRATSTMVDVTERIPGINLLLGRIRSRKRKEKVVLAIVIATCICILFFVAS
ncbi:protein transport protein gos1 [Linderina pennispora]|nr:protein transport protein gos1 [Linderina pennispora]